MDGSLRNLFSLASDKKRFIYELWPELFGDSLTPNEWEYWIAFFVLQQAEMNDIDPNVYDVEEVMELLNEKDRKRKIERENMGKSHTSNRSATYGS